jgi:hypothetical protein
MTADLFTDPFPPVTRVTDAHQNMRVTSWPFPGTDLASPDPRTLDCRGLTFVRSGLRAPIKLRREHQATGTRLVGGFVTSTGTPDTPWSWWHDQYAAIVEHDEAVIIGTRIDNVGDAVSFQARDWRILGCEITRAHDDAIENDNQHDGLVLDCLLDGVHVGFSSSGSEDGRSNRVLISRTLVRLEGYEQSYATARFGTGQHGGFFKWTPLAPPPVITDCVFRIDQPAAYGGPYGRPPAALPPGATAHNVTLIGHQHMTEAELATWRSQSVGLTLAGPEAWDAAAHAWRLAHPAPAAEAA